MLGGEIVNGLPRIANPTGLKIINATVDHRQILSQACFLGQFVISGWAEEHGGCSTVTGHEKRPPAFLGLPNVLRQMWPDFAERLNILSSHAC